MSIAGSLTAPLAVLLVIAMGACEKPRLQPARQDVDQDSAARATMESYLDVGEQRLFTGRGPQHRLPDSYYGFARTHSKVAIDVLRTRLNSENANHRWNAYDFLVAMIDAPDVRSEVVPIITNAAKTEGVGIQEFLAPVLKKLDDRTNMSP